MPPVAVLTREYGTALDDVARLATRDVVDLWRLTPADARQTVRLLLAEAPAIAETYGSVASTLGADLYDDVRAVSRAAGRYSAVGAGTAPVSQVEALARWSVGPLFAAEPDVSLALANFSGGIDRLVRQPYRQTIVRNAGRDKASKGVMRVASAGACAFCSELAAVVHFVDADGESNADQWHRNCGCSAAPAF